MFFVFLFIKEFFGLWHHAHNHLMHRGSVLILLEIFAKIVNQLPMIIEELEPGYRFKEKLIKAAKVKIAKLKK